MELDLDNIEFQTALDLIQETNQSFFLTGKAGTGKSTFLKHIVETTSKNYVVVAPTGIAAVNVGGVTIHSFFQFPLRPLLPEDEDIKVFWKNSEKRKIISAMDTLIIDEVSMVRADLIDGIDYSLRRNGGNPNLPFGGKQVVFVGDIFQLEPVTIRKSGEQKIINEIYGSAYFYNAKVFEKINLFTVELQKVYRQTDLVFISLLDKVRVKETLQTDIDRLNSRVFSESELKKKEFAITLTTKNDLADRVNSIKLSELKTNPFQYTAEVSGEFEESKYPTEPEMILKEGSQVIFIKNDTDKRWVNGTIGQVNELTDTTIKVKLKDGSVHSVDKRVWENIKYQYNKEKKKIEQEIVGTFKQYPLKLAWAITIHKSQGLTFDRVVIDFGDGTFASGQAYVALSRATTFEGLFLKQKMHTMDIYIDEEIKDFAKSFNDKSLINQKLNEGKEVYQFTKNENWEKAGKYYFKKAMSFLKLNQFNAAYENLITGYDYITCDCTIGDWFNKDEVSEIFSNATNFDCSAFKLDFLKSFIFYHTDKYAAALNSISSFIDLQPSNEIGYYFKGKILNGLEKYTEALDNFKNALNLKRKSRTLYRIGRTKEESLNDYGLNEMYEAIVMNPSSGHAHWHFAEYAIRRKIFPYELKNYRGSYHENGTISSLRIGIAIEKIFEETGKQGISDYMLSLEKAMKLSQNNIIDNLEEDADYSDDYDDYSDNHDYDRDTFNAMTDGQLGDWDDFDGDIDDVMTWSGR
ncbi:AAA family ATPase [Vicingus serpentipes]|uniref:AAA family ATPase n=1 Tax=Vicingus serpentipes TaxID=1926625 RepID=A0A5C6RV27_9FLAO|nr:AAA family ATPase [Vicingus serpentipes]TXB66201.1 AAA family ATPase [Vicingus serpentipes]